jgi:hypothetical protein
LKHDIPIVSIIYKTRIVIKWFEFICHQAAIVQYDYSCLLIEEHNELLQMKGEGHRQITLSPSDSSKFEQSVDWRSKLPGKEKGKEKDRKLPTSAFGKMASITKSMSSRDRNIRPMKSSELKDKDKEDLK